MSGSSQPPQKKLIGRRDLLKAAGAAPVALAGLASVATASEAATPASAPAARPHLVLDEHEWTTVSVLGDWIIPADEHTGSASAAGVPAFIDDWLNLHQGNLLAEVRGGLLWLDVECNRLHGHDFVACTQAQQQQMLERIAWPDRADPADSHAVAFFTTLRDLVANGFYTSEMGVRDLQYLGNRAQPSWEGCPEDALQKLDVAYDDATHNAFKPAWGLAPGGLTPKL